MAHGLNSVLRRAPGAPIQKGDAKSGGGIGSRRIFAPHFKLQVLDSYRNDADCKGNQRATARKYGIHRRQIQKWLQCEANLRNSIGGARPPKTIAAVPVAVAVAAPRQRGDADHAPPVDHADRAPYSPASPPHSPLDYTMHSRSHTSSPPPLATSVPLPLTSVVVDDGATSPDPAAPMDLSLKRAVHCSSPCSPDRMSNYGEAYMSPPHTPSASPSHPCHPLVPAAAPPPNLPSPPSTSHIWDLSLRGEKRRIDSTPADRPKPKLFKPYLDDVRDEPEKETAVTPPCCSCLQPIPEGEAFFYNNNHIPDQYTVYELQPKSTLNYFYPLSKPSLYSNAVECDPYYMPYENHLLSMAAPLKQRQTYSIDFKLSAIECYYQDSICRGNQRAVANKYNIHRRQVQKWLKQEEELRQRNESAHVHVHAVR